MSFKVETCCGCVVLRTGCFIIGYLRLIANLILPVLLTAGVLDYQVVHMQLGLIFLEDANKLYGPTLVFVILINLIFNATLLYGLHQNQLSWIRTYLVFTVFVLVATCMIFVHVSVVSSTGKMVLPISTATILFDFMLNILGQLYCYLVIRSYYLKIAEAKKGPPIVDKV